MNPSGGQRPLVVAHRGSSGSAPENTMAAFRLAVDAGADMIEFDVRMTRDFELVVHHDRSLGRTSDGSGRVWDLTLDELREALAGLGEPGYRAGQVFDWLYHKHADNGLESKEHPAAPARLDVKCPVCGK